jgi:hypothetical protein
MAWYTLHDLTLEVQQDGREPGAELARLLRDLSCVRTPGLDRRPSLRLAGHRCARALRIPGTARPVFQAEGLWGFEDGADFYLTEGTSCLHLHVSKGQGAAHLSPAFGGQPLLVRQRFWAVGLLKLLRPLERYGLHAAGLVAPTGAGLLIVGGSGSGKSTLTIGLLRQGWHYLSDDAVLLRAQPAGVDAWALRKPFSVDARVAAAYGDLPLGPDGPHPAGRRKRRVEVFDAYPHHYAAHCHPQVLLFPRLIPHAQSTVRPLARPHALGQLLAQSGPQLFDRATMPPHLAVLTRLVHQATPYELLAGQDLYDQPGRLAALVADVEGAK